MARGWETYADFTCRKHVCHVCSKRFVRPAELARHIRVHTGERPYSCSKCPRTFKHNFEMKKHEKCCGMNNGWPFSYQVVKTTGGKSLQSRRNMCVTGVIRDLHVLLSYLVISVYTQEKDHLSAPDVHKHLNIRIIYGNTLQYAPRTSKKVDKHLNMCIFYGTDI
jgi:hypothetical protein